MSIIKSGRENPLYKHGMYGTKTYRVWAAMLARCRNRKAINYHRYGGRGICVCERWQSFENFLADMGERPEGMSIDRIDNNGNYEPSNCRWVTIKVQNRNCRTNKLLCFNGQVRCEAEWAEMLQLQRSTIAERIKSGWTIEKSFLAPLRGRSLTLGQRKVAGQL